MVKLKSFSLSQLSHHLSMTPGSTAFFQTVV